MKWKTIIVSFSIVVTIGLIITLSVYYGTDFNVSEYNFYSNIERVLPSNDYLPIILEIENMSGESIYFETLNEEIRGHIENITKMIEKEQEFLQNHNPREYRDSYKSHKFNYTAILTFDFNRDYIEHLIENSIGNPTFYFYNNWSAMGYVAYSNYLGDYEGNFSTWDSDNDGIYAEWPHEEQPEDINIDLIPDVAVGRLPVRNKLEVIIMVQKIIQYERNAYGQPWFNDIVLIAGDTYPEIFNANWTGYEGEEYADEALSYLTGFNPTKLYTSNGNLTGPQVVIDTISQGCGLLYFVGHGNPMTWGNHPPNNKTFVTGLSVDHIPKLKNGEKQPICVVSGCHNSQFDVSVFRILNSLARYRGEYTPECWSWWLTRKIGGGSVATLGCSALGYTKEDKDSFDGGLNWVEVEFFRQYGQENQNIIGDAWQAAVANYVTNYPVYWNQTTAGDSFIDAKVPQSFVLFGDPSLAIGGISI